MAIKLSISRHVEGSPVPAKKKTTLVVERAKSKPETKAKRLVTPKKKEPAKKLIKAVVAKKEKKVSAKKIEKIDRVKKETFVLDEGDFFPEFSLPSSDGGVVSKRGLHGESFVLYFYPKDMTPGCTTEAHEFSLLAQEFAHVGYRIFGVSADSMERHRKFIVKEHIVFPLLSDEKKILAEACGVLTKGIARTTFVVGKTGIIEKVYRKVDARGHGACVYKDLTVKMP